MKEKDCMQSILTITLVYSSTNFEVAIKTENLALQKLSDLTQPQPIDEWYYNAPPN
jgi:hypothetical protein